MVRNVYGGSPKQKQERHSYLQGFPCELGGSVKDPMFSWTLPKRFGYLIVSQITLETSVKAGHLLEPSFWAPVKTP
jgi:hypothetical protein